MTRRGIFATIAGFITGLFGTARVRSWQSPWIKLTPGPTKKITEVLVMESGFYDYIAKGPTKTAVDFHLVDSVTYERILYLYKD